MNGGRTVLDEGEWGEGGEGWKTCVAGDGRVGLSCEWTDRDAVSIDVEPDDAIEIGVALIRSACYAASRLATLHVLIVGGESDFEVRGIFTSLEGAMKAARSLTGGMTAQAVVEEWIPNTVNGVGVSYLFTGDGQYLIHDPETPVE